MHILEFRIQNVLVIQHRYYRGVSEICVLNANNPGNRFISTIYYSRHYFPLVEHLTPNVSNLY